MPSTEAALILDAALEGRFLCLHGFNGSAHGGSTERVQVRTSKRAKLGNLPVDEFTLFARWPSRVV
jgi:hypothetical protein